MSTVNASIQGLLGLLQLGQRARAADTAEALGFIAVNEARTVFAYRQAALWREGAGGVVALSGVPQVERDAPYVQWLARLFRAIAPVNAPKAIDPAALPVLLAEEWSTWLPQHALAIPLVSSVGGVRGVLLLAREQAWSDEEKALAGELGALFGHALHALRPREALWQRVRGLLRQRRAWWKVALGLLVVSLVPVRLSALAQAEVTPVDPFVVRTPLDGVIDRMQVQPNQPVKAGTPLFDLDATTLRSRYDAARKAFEAAQEEYQQSAQQAVTDDKSRLEMAERRGDMAQKAVDMNFAADQLARVQVKAAREGVAVFADVNDWTGKAVSVGEKVLVLADPGKVELTGYLPVADQIALKPGADVTFYPKASPFTAYHARVETVAYRAAPTDEAVLAYRVKARFVSGEPVPRLGLMGTARLYAGRVPLIYYLLRRPLASLRQWLG
ncbi:HlyD family efflux transporter periplasmic adaptor subunit [Fulvimonas sp. R45]|uniref:efflux RND transporter periplasmic adaptor subunit n=1 Tax=Fulvimonas sp. R45 TaxID=3045937 RepID=UPI00265FE3C9|nr:HlyD family efflux transporter periplasmic adaptor subunit [Fulvimonas sp. R45]MDO1530357.1 HlyD family efflux transporter periplasmic adaptor subunit [Fulvimonas sp. R45]